MNNMEIPELLVLANNQIISEMEASCGRE